ncbi:hypothetical protein [Ferruginivarius sediminum]|uniref:Uncharacterized protein n=1 Tax=Ferruginivarius sediminum TaxID=2661937 RepID=A0A369TC21_9PROT|nr:hypothetical protein [Ferruginivarius sediminum]RDD60466.1 hypothetical protein DRB17_17860 [Ferruginivarius sediminum]
MLTQPAARRAKAAPPKTTLEEMTRAIVKRMQDGAVTITRQDLAADGFMPREIDNHGDAAIAEARRRVANTRVE